MTDARLVLVTGGAGFVGVPTVRLLLEQGFQVVVVDNFSVAAASRLGALARSDQLRIVRADLRDADALVDAVREARPWAAIHLAALHYIPYCVANPAETVAVNVLGVQHLLDALTAANVERLVFASTGDVYLPDETPHGEEALTTPTSVYGASKLAGEWLIRVWRASGAGTVPVVARLFNVYGPGETNPHVIPHLCESMRRGDVLPLGNIDAKRDYTFVDDVAAVFVALATSEVGDVTVNIGAGRSWSVREVVEELGRLTGRELHIKIEPDRLRKTDRPNLQADLTRLRRLLPGFTPTPLEVGLRRLLLAEGIEVV